MKTSFNEDIKLIGIGEFSSSLCGKFSDYYDTISFLKTRGQSLDTKITFVMKEFDYSVSQQVNSIMEYERDQILRNVFSKINVVMTQLDNRFNESMARALANFLSRHGSFVVLILFIPLGSDEGIYREFIKDMREVTDIVEVINPEEVIRGGEQYKINELNEIYVDRVKDLIFSLELINENSNLLGISIRDLKEQSSIFGPLKIKVFKYNLSNFQILERDIVNYDNKIRKETVNRVYLIMLINQNFSLSEPMGPIKYFKSRYSEVRNAFFRNDDVFGAIVIYSLKV